MNFSLIVKNNLELKKYALTSPLVSLGGANSSDIQLKELKGEYSLLLNRDEVKLVSYDNDKEKIIRTIYQTKENTLNYLKLEVYELIVVKGQFPLEREVVDWNYYDLPKKVDSVHYPQRILEFILKSTNLTQGALFFKQKDNLETLATKDLNMDSEGARFLCHFIKSAEQEELIPVNFQTHTLLFGRKKEIDDFVILRVSCLEQGEILLYIPRLNKESKVPAGLIKTLLFLFTHSLTLHLIYKFNQHLVFSKEEKDGYFWGTHPQMIKAKSMADKLAPSDLSILIHGETGTGKEGLAQYVASHYGNKKMVTVNCAAIPQNLAESFFFGHMKGAFTGATQNQIGKVTEADGGVLFLDEVAELDLEIQAKILRVLQDKVVKPVGGKEHKVNVKIVAATHQNLIQMIGQKTFREDLYFRINEAQLTLPPLRERTEDIIPLAHFFLHDSCLKNEIPKKYLSPEAQKMLLRYSFPGNVRELRALMRRISILCEETVVTEDNMNSYLSDRPKQGNDYPLNLYTARALFIQDHIRKVLAHTKGNKTEAAQLLGISARNIFRLMSPDNSVIAMDEDVT